MIRSLWAVNVKSYMLIDDLVLTGCDEKLYSFVVNTKPLHGTVVRMKVFKNLYFP